MNPIVLPFIQLVQKIIPLAFNDKPETKFDLSAFLNIALIAALVYLMGAADTEMVLDLAEACK